MGGIPSVAERDDHGRRPLRHQVVEAGHGLEGCFTRYAARRSRDERRVRPRVLRRRLHDQPPAQGRHRRQGMGRLRVRRRATRAGARRPSQTARPAPLLLEERQVGPRPRATRPRRARLLGVLRLPQLRRPVERAALPRGLTWQLGSVVELVDETPRTKSIALALPAWPGHRAGQHVDVRLTAEDGYQAQRSYASASAPERDRRRGLAPLMLLNRKCRAGEYWIQRGAG